MIDLCCLLLVAATVVILISPWLSGALQGSAAARSALPAPDPVVPPAPEPVPPAPAAVATEGEPAAATPHPEAPFSAPAAPTPSPAPPTADPATPAPGTVAPDDAGAGAESTAAEAPPALSEATPPLQRPTPPGDAAARARQAEEYAQVKPRSVLALQQFRRTSTTRAGASRGREGIANLINLNPTISEWYVLELRWRDGKESRHHLVNAHPGAQELLLDSAWHSGIVLRRDGVNHRCDLWSAGPSSAIEEAARARGPWIPVCGGEVYLRVPTRGSRTSEEWAADFLRDKVVGGEKLTVLVRKTLYSEKFLATARVSPSGTAGESAVALGESDPDGPPAAAIAPDRVRDALDPRDLDIEHAGGPRMGIGRWYAARDNPGVYVSTIAPGLVAPEILGRHKGRVHPLDPVESTAQAYLIAFDLARFELGFALGTDHPRVGWSGRAAQSVRDGRLPGPDGIDSLAPLVPTGMLAPQLAARAVATFAGGFKRDHGAFKFGRLATVNSGSHYGFIESGAVLSRLQPGLATVYALADGRVVMKTWTAADDAQLERIRFARQNGVAILERDPAGGPSVPGALVTSWGEGNWSGTQDRKLRAVRAGICMARRGEREFLLYGYFSSSTPSAMAQVFLAYGCEYAMHLDMNALEHTYLALYRAAGGKLEVQHLVRGMNVLDRPAGSGTLPRFLGFADNRDFFFLLRRPATATLLGAAGGSRAAGDEFANARSGSSTSEVKP